MVCVRPGHMTGCPAIKRTYLNALWSRAPRHEDLAPRGAVSATVAWGAVAGMPSDTYLCGSSLCEQRKSAQGVLKTWAARHHFFPIKTFPSGNGNIFYFL